MFLEFPFEYSEVEGLGKLFYPTVKLGIKTIIGWREFKFLVDTGADVTAVPLDILSLIGIPVSQLPTSHTLGVGGYSVRTHEFQLPLKLGTQELLVHACAIETKDRTIPLLLGRKDLFETHFSLTLDSKRKMTVISHNGDSS